MISYQAFQPRFQPTSGFLFRSQTSIRPIVRLRSDALAVLDALQRRWRRARAPRWCCPLTTCPVRPRCQQPTTACTSPPRATAPSCSPARALPAVSSPPLLTWYRYMAARFFYASYPRLHEDTETYPLMHRVYTGYIAVHTSLYYTLLYTYDERLFVVCV